MEWNRAKNILILSFLALNVLLGYQLWASRLNVTGSNADSEQLTQEIKSLLASHNIQLKATLPPDTPKMKEITVTYDQRHDPKAVTDIHPAAIAGSAVTDAGLRRLLGKAIPNLKEYRIDPVMTGQDTIVLHQLYGDYPMFDVNMSLYEHNGAIVRYRQQYVVEQNPATGNKEQTILSGITAVGSLVENNHLQPGTVITDVRLGYHGQMFNSETQVLAPAWRVATSTGDIFYVQAVTGGVMSDQKETTS